MVLSSLLCLKVEVPSSLIGFQRPQTNKAKISMILYCTLGRWSWAQRTELVPWDLALAFLPSVTCPRFQALCFSFNKGAFGKLSGVTQTPLDCALIFQGGSISHITIGELEAIFWLRNTCTPEPLNFLLSLHLQLLIQWVIEALCLFKYFADTQSQI